MTLQGDVKRIFTGWMFAASPGCAVEHPIYDVWLTDCKNPDLPVIAAPPPEAAPAAPAARPAAGHAAASAAAVAAGRSASGDPRR